MRNLLTIITILFSASIFAQTPAANAGSDITIYLTQGNSVSLTGTATNRSSSLWREVSTDYSSGATIISPSSLTTTVTGLPQGVFYFELSVTSPTDVVTTDTVVVRVDYDVPPATSTLISHPVWADMAYNANLRDDTTTCYSWTNSIHDLAGNAPNVYEMEKDGTLGSHIDSMREKYYSTILDGHGCSGYGRSELIPSGSVDNIDTSKIYVLEWKGYFPQDMSTVAVSDYATVIGQIHGGDGYSPPLSFKIRNNNIYFAESFENGNGQGSSIYNPSVGYYTIILPASDLVNKTHTFRVTVREGSYYPNQKAFIKVEIDGVQKYYRGVGQVGSTLMTDWIKAATMYDHSNLITDATNYTRGSKYSLTTESYRVYTVTDTTSNIAPTANAGSNQTITLPTNSVTLSGSGTDTDGSISSYAWTKEVGGSATITSPNSATTTVTGLAAGTYVFRLTVTDNQGATGSDTVHVTVNAATPAPTIYAGDNQSTTLNSVTLTATYTTASGHTGTFQWVKESGGSATITSPTSSTTTVTGLVAGSYRFGCTLTQDDSQTAYDYVLVTVNNSGIINFHVDKIVFKGGKKVFRNAN